MNNRKVKNRVKTIFKYIGLAIASIIATLVISLAVLLYGPFHQLRDLYVITMMETSAAKFMATWFLSDATIEEIYANNRLEVVDEPTDPSLVSIAVTTAPTSTSTPPTLPSETTTEPTTSATVTEPPLSSSERRTSAVTEPPETTPPETTPSETTTIETTEATTVTTVDPLVTKESAPDELFANHPDAMHETDGLDGLQLVKVSGTSFTGYMLVISDPSRVHLGVSISIMNNYKFGWNNSYGEQLRSMVSRTGAVAAINGGAFYDPDGQGNGGRPDGALCVDGNLLYWGPEVENDEAEESAKREWRGDKVNIIGINNENILVLGRFTKDEFLKQGFRDAVSFDNPDPPFLVINGKASTVVGTGGSGIQPRTCIGQRADGAFLFLVIDGRGAGGSLGATQKEAMNLLLEFGAVNAANLDGGSSSEMIINGVTISNPCSIYGPRFMPDGFLVR